MANNKYFFSCTDCGQEFHDAEFMYLCPECSKKNSAQEPPYGVLKMYYDYSRIAGKTSRSKLFKLLKSEGYLPLLPIENLSSLGPLKVGNTPLIEVVGHNNETKDFSVFAKDDARNPTFSFKDRASVLVSAFALEHGIDTIVAASTGNAGSSLAGICAANGQKAIIFVPATAPKAKLTQILMYGAQIVPVNGTYDQAFDLSLKVTEKYGHFNRNTAYNPLTIEGKKTVAYEIFDQLGEMIPDKIFVPVGDGVIISGVFKGFEDLIRLGITEKMPQIIAVQATGSSNIVKNLHSDMFISTGSQTIADSISVNIPRNFRMAKKYLLEYRGEALSVSDESIMSASLLCSQNTGLFVEPASATAYAGLLEYMRLRKIAPDEKAVVILTGSGLKDLSAVQTMINMPPAVEADTEINPDML